MNSKTNFAILIISLGYLPSFGGSYRVLHELLERVNGKEVLLLTSKGFETEKFDKKISYKINRGRFISILTEDGFISNKINIKKINDIFYFYVIKKIFKFLVFPILTFCYLIYFVKSRNFKTLIFAQSVFPFSWFIILFKKFINTRIITFVYGEDIVSYRKNLKIFKYLRKIYLHGLKKADIVIANSSVTKKECVFDGINHEKIHIIYPAVDYDMFKPLDKEYSRNLFGIKNHFVILSVGRLIRRKGFDIVLDILPDIYVKIPNILYIICGEGYDKEYLIAKAKAKGILNYVIFLEKVTYELLPYLYSASDIFVLPNRLDEKDNEQEGFGIVFLEANACGIPVIGGDSGGVKDIIENGVNGFLVNPIDKADISNKIFELYYSKNKYTESSIRSYIIKKYNWDDSAKCFQKLL